MNRVILVSNRLPVTVTISDEGVRIERSIGGLATALREPHERSGGLWIGWPGPTEGLQARDLANVEARFSELGTVPVHLSTQELGTFYEGFANGMVWPLFHYITANLPLRIEGWDSYRDVNERFAEVVAAHHQPGDLIWIHDYQLMLVPGMVRQRLPDARIGFFLHIPFPSSELFAVLPRREEILYGLLGADLIGFHTSWYERHFVSAVARILGISARNRTITVGGRPVHLDVFPV
ncbi:MAG TPA: trehalose-6-phosphate synthase, partial [Longimicrobiales bacterium]|nr:trehalose-6-phosphate synthase [Longimicrobiales bacterium]